MADIHRPPLLSSSQQQEQDTPATSHLDTQLPAHLAPIELPPNSWVDQPPTQAGNPRAR
jgi:hypothetical protein